MIYDHKEGCLRMVDVRAYMDSLKITWLRRLLGSECSSWAYLCQRILVLMILFFNRRWSNRFISFSETLFGGNRFCVDVLTSWQKFTAVHKASTHGKVLKLHFGTTIKLRLAIRVFITSIIGIQLLDDNGCYHIDLNFSTITPGNLNYNLIKK